MIHHYPLTQSLYNKEYLFVMSEIFDSKKYRAYSVKYFLTPDKDPKKTKTVICLHTDIEEYLKVNPGARASLPNFAEGEPRINIYIDIFNEVKNENT